MRALDPRDCEIIIQYQAGSNEEEEERLRRLSSILLDAYQSLRERKKREDEEFNFDATPEKYFGLE